MIILLITIISCKKDENTTPAPATITGTWVNAVSAAKLLINTNKTYTINVNNTSIENGTYSTNASIISFTPSSSLYCTGGVVATYSFSVTSVSLKLSQINEGCTKRFEYLDLQYIRQQ